MGAEIRAEQAREAARQAQRDADRAEAELWSIRMEAFGGPAQPSPTIGECLRGGLCFLEVECHRCKTRASLPLDAIRRPRNTPIWKLEASLKCRSCSNGSYAPPVHVIRLTETRQIAPLSMGSPGCGKVSACSAVSKNQAIRLAVASREPDWPHMGEEFGD